MWGRPLNEAKMDDDTSKKEGKNINYKTECPVYDPEIYNDYIQGNNLLEEKVKNFYPINLNAYSTQQTPTDINNQAKTKPSINKLNSQGGGLSAIGKNYGGFQPYYPSMDKNAMVFIKIILLGRKI